MKPLGGLKRAAQQAVQTARALGYENDALAMLRATQKTDDAVLAQEALIQQAVGHLRRATLATAAVPAPACEVSATDLRAQADALEAQAAAYLTELTGTPPTRGGPWHPLKQLHAVLRQEATLLRERAAWTAELERCRAQAEGGGGV
ncbi:hypothetical protein K7W42_19190 [Deinococcus sp. HMF7604]|uniref:hypothetical protein n=1 Tax=Deinococcus betulae TaxID=2873312 RepID=UPI001CCE549A|nr:hypothetical protein [Deinococcus betulae]MBZ9752966.1 hypothetical protein [Deinococcus betulae]